jgi:branched-chain amino acid transport system permease protein
VGDLYQTLITVLSVGSLYALIALGYTMVYGILKFINFAHSDVVVLGAWVSFTASAVLLPRLGISPVEAPWWAAAAVLLLAMAVCGTVGFCIERFAYRPLRSAPRLNVLITAIGVSLFLQNAGQLRFEILKADGPDRPALRLPFGAQPQGMPRLLGTRALNDTTVSRGVLAGVEGATVRLSEAARLEEGRRYTLRITPATGGRAVEAVVVSASGEYPAGSDLRVGFLPAGVVPGSGYALVRAARVPIQLVDVAIVCTAGVLMVLLQLLVYRTKFGMAMRAVSFNTVTASLMGVAVNRVISTTFVIGTSLAAAAGFLYSLKYVTLQQTAHQGWVLLGLKAFVSAVVGGIGNIHGAVLGGFLIAIVEQFGARYISSDLRDVYVFGVLILVLLLRPTGIMGSTVREKV